MCDAKRNILTRDYVLATDKVKKSGLSDSKVNFLFKTLERTFGHFYFPEDESFSDPEMIHPIFWELIDSTGKGLVKLFNLCLEVSVIEEILGHDEVLIRMKNPKQFNGARAEIYFGARLRTATRNVSFVKTKINQKQPDYEINTGNYSFVVEVKGSSKTDYEIGLEMFEGFTRSGLNRLFPQNNLTRTVKLGELWLGGIAAVCSMNSKVENCAWAIQSSIESLASKAVSLISDKIKNGFKANQKNDYDIEIFTTSNIEETKDPFIIELPQAIRIASIGNIIQKLTCPNNIEQLTNLGIFAFYTLYAINSMIAEILLNNIIIQCPQLREKLLGIAIFNNEGIPPIFIHSPNSFPSELWFPNYFKEPVWNEKLGMAVLP